LLKIYFAYIIGIHVLGIAVLGTYASIYGNVKAELNKQNLNIWLWAYFHTSSCFYNAGFSLIPGSLVPINKEYFILFISCLLVSLGNCLFPIALRCIIVAASRISYFNQKTRSALRFLAKNPRRSSIHLFSAKHTWILFFVRVIPVMASAMFP
jgi:Trk-type K+ transport system membrane component